MKSAQTKKNFSVKEAANILGVSTNTLYKYLSERKIKSRRYGKGRFKIPVNELEPFLESSGVHTVVSDSGSKGKNWISRITSQVNLHSKFRKFKSNLKVVDEIGGGDIKSGVNDIVFFRIFKAVVFLGLGFINLFPFAELSSIEIGLLDPSNQIFLKMLPFGLLISGIFNLLEVLNTKKFKLYHLLFDAFSVLVLIIYSIFALISQQWGIFVFTSGFIAIALGHLISKGERGYVQLDFFSTFTRFCLFLGIFGGMALIVSPKLLPIEQISNYIVENKIIFAFLWFTVFTVPTIYILSPSGRKSVIILPFFMIFSIISVIFAIHLTFTATWDVSYLLFLNGIFGFFMAWWSDDQRTLVASRVWIVLTCFLWISATVAFGLFSLNVSRNEIKSRVATSLNDSVVKITENVNNNFSHTTSVMRSYAGSKEMERNLTNQVVADSLITKAREIYDQVEGVKRVLIYNKDGIAVGVYPRNSLFQGTDFSTQEYFSRTKLTHKSYVSPLFESIAGEPVVIQTEPIFSNNEFIGMMGIAYDLKNFVNFIKIEANYSYEIEGVDMNGFVVFSSDSTKVGSLDAYSDLNTKEYVAAEYYADIPKWNVVISSQITPAVGQISNLNIMLSILLILNALFSISAGIMAAKRREFDEKENRLNKVASSVANSGFI